MPTWAEIVDSVVKLTPSIITVSVSIAAVRISVLQYRINKDKLRLDLFNKRLEAYEKLQKFLGAVLTEGHVNEEGLKLLWDARHSSRFLFDDSVNDVFETMWTKASAMRACRQKTYGTNPLPVGPEREKVCEEESNLLAWMLNELRTSDVRYKKYLHFE